MLLLLGFNYYLSGTGMMDKKVFCFCEETKSDSKHPHKVSHNGL